MLLAGPAFGFFARTFCGVRGDVRVFAHPFTTRRALVPPRARAFFDFSSRVWTKRSLSLFNHVSSSSSSSSFEIKVPRSLDALPFARHHLKANVSRSPVQQPFSSCTKRSTTYKGESLAGLLEAFISFYNELSFSIFF